MHMNNNFREFFKLERDSFWRDVTLADETNGCEGNSSSPDTSLCITGEVTGTYPY